MNALKLMMGSLFVSAVACGSGSAGPADPGAPGPSDGETPSSLADEGTNPSSGSGQGIDIPVDPDTSSSGETTGVTTASSSSSSSSSSGGPACGGQSSCTACIISNCATEFAACGNDVPCCCFLDCLDSGQAQTDCTTECSISNNTVDLLNCGLPSCSTCPTT
jgi:hypothetical protein